MSSLSFGPGQYLTSIQEVNHDKEAAPPVTNWLPREEGDEESDEDFEIGGQTQQYRCPLTLRTFTDAVVRSVHLDSASHGPR